MEPGPRDHAVLTPGRATYCALVTGPAGVSLRTSKPHDLFYARRDMDQVLPSRRTQRLNEVLPVVINPGDALPVISALQMFP